MLVKPNVGDIAVAPSIEIAVVYVAYNVSHKDYALRCYRGGGETHCSLASGTRHSRFGLGSAKFCDYKLVHKCALQPNA